MRLVIVISMVVLLSSATSICQAVPQGTPCNCQSCKSHGCTYQGHAQGCCCESILKQAPSNPLAPGRPSPPPCCADGFAYANYTTWGHYPTRWRHWPIHMAATMPGAGQTLPQLGPDVPTYQPLPPEEEDRRAPPPTTPREEATPRAAPAEQDGESAAPPDNRAPAKPESDELPDSFFGLPSLDVSPSDSSTPSTTPLTPPPGTQDTPNTLPLPSADPFGDDVPPAPPFATPRLQGPVIRSASQPVQPAIKQPVKQAEPQDDPPPALPSSLASVAR